MIDYIRNLVALGVIAVAFSAPCQLGTQINNGSASNSAQVLTVAVQPTAFDFYKSALEDQNRIYLANLETQQRVSETTIRAVVKSEEAVKSVVEIVSIAVGAVVAVFGGWVGFVFSQLNKSRVEANEKLENIRKEVNQVRGDLVECSKGLGTLSFLKERLDKITDLDEMLADTKALSYMLNVRVRLMSNDQREVERAVEQAANQESSRFVPLLIEALRVHQSVYVQTEALYGLKRHGAAVAKDKTAIGLIKEASRHPDSKVRRAAVDCMRSVDPHSFQDRLFELRDDDSDKEVNTAARQVLQDAGISDNRKSHETTRGNEAKNIASSNLKG